MTLIFGFYCVTLTLPLVQYCRYDMLGSSLACCDGLWRTERSETLLPVQLETENQEQMHKAAPSLSLLACAFGITPTQF